MMAHLTSTQRKAHHLPCTAVVVQGFDSPDNVAEMPSKTMVFLYFLCADGEQRVGGFAPAGSRYQSVNPPFVPRLCFDRQTGLIQRAKETTP